MEEKEAFRIVWRKMRRLFVLIIALFSFTVFLTSDFYEGRYYADVKGVWFLVDILWFNEWTKNWLGTYLLFGGIVVLCAVFLVHTSPSVLRIPRYRTKLLTLIAAPVITGVALTGVACVRVCQIWGIGVDLYFLSQLLVGCVWGILSGLYAVWKQRKSLRSGEAVAV